MVPASATDVSEPTPASRRAAVTRPWFGWLLLAGALGVVLARAPALVVAPNLWAEEGTLFFVRAWAMPWTRVLTMHPADYLLAWSNVGVLLATRLASLEWAPHVMVAWALVGHACPLAVLATSRAPAWRSPWVRVAAVAVVLFAGASAEVWLNTIQSQAHLTLAAALLLLEPPPATRRCAAAQLALLVACGTSGPGTSVLLPLYLWRAWHVRHRATAVQAAVLAACALLQIAVWPGRAADARRGVGVDVASAARVAVLRAAVAPVAGGPGMTAVGELIARTGERVASAVPRLAGGTSTPVAGVGWLALVLGVLTALVSGTAPREWIPLAGAWLLATAAAIGAGVGGPALLLAGPEAASRYFYAPTVLILLLLLRSGTVHAARRHAVRAGLCLLLVAAGIASGTVRWRAPLERPTGWPVWRDEVAAWRRDPTRPLRIWPPGWAIRLPPPDGAP